jgi:hypothetical protein
MDDATMYAANQPTISAHGRARTTIDKAGIKGAQFVTKYGEKIHMSVKKRVDSNVAAGSTREPRNVNLGGAATAGTLGGAKRIVGAGAGLAAGVIDKVSSVIGGALANNPAMKNMRDAPEESGRRKAHDLLVSGAMAVGRVYVAADNQGKLIFETAGDGAGRIAGVKYGPEAENAARATGHIALDGYRIFRFPAKLGATSLIKGAMKGGMQAHAQSAQLTPYHNSSGGDDAFVRQGFHQSPPLLQPEPYRYNPDAYPSIHRNSNMNDNAF